MARRVVPGRNGSLAGVVADLARPVAVVGSALPVGDLEVVFRDPGVSSVVVRDDAGSPRVGVVTRARLTSALTGRLGYGRAVLDRKPTASVADWAPLLVSPSTPVSEVATRAMARPDEQRYDDVLVAGESWACAATADVMRALVAALAQRSTRDPLTGMATRAAVWHGLTHRCSMARGSGGSRVVVVLLDVRGMTDINARYGGAAGDAVLVGIADRIRAALPRGCEAGRVDGDRFAVLGTLPAMDDARAAASAEGFRGHLISQLLTPPDGVEPSWWPTVHTSVVWSLAGGADPDELVREGERRLVAAAHAARGLARAS
ncbi:diguanylate cyclase (GGDEF)-like protein [Luteimicrobium subarcticum]|uniref:Diguanylate cyclase (GGDEF)-like protein n=2 Tax=Luteimicrobium subarcticum TaxID=620910 RepID=A0A2M8WJC9_9MICO|nr:diguanylate cyclase (GGDEF)-like protein [Luteimicrobium subarcticum]